MASRMVKVPVRKKDGLQGGRSHYSEEQRYEAVAQYLILGSVAEVSRITKIHKEALFRWKSEPWWQEAVDEIRKGSALEHAGKLQKVINSSINVLQDRLDKGDLQYNAKNGKIVRVGVKAAVANQITKDMIDRKALLEKLSNKSYSTEESIDNRLKSLQEEFLKFAKAKTIEVEQKDIPNVIDVK
jgi:transposase-like protein